MTLALTAFQAYAVEIDEPLQKRFIQRAEFDITGAATDATYDFGTYAGTFWTAVGGSTVGAVALKAVKDINVAATCFLWAGGLGLTGKTMVGGTGGSVISYNSAASAGGAATEALAVVGLATTDTILAVSQQAKGANSTALNLWTDTGRTVDVLTVGWTANPGAGSIVRVLVRKASAATTPVAGQYQIVLDGTNTKIPNITFGTADAPLVAKLVLEWELPNNAWPIQVKSP